MSSFRPLLPLASSTLHRVARFRRPRLSLASWIVSLFLVLVCSPAMAVNFYYVDSYPTPQDAIDAAEAAGGGVVRFPCGVTTLSSGLVIDSRGVTLEGCGPEGSVLRASFSTGNIVSLGNTTTAFSPCGGVRDLSITSSVTRTSGYSIAVAGCEQGVIDNVRIQTQGGHGLHFSDSSDHLAAIFFVRAVDIEIRGAFTAIRLDGSNERHFSNLWLRGNETAGSRGIVVTSTGGDWFKDVESVLFEVGVEITPPSGKSVDWSNFDNVLADTNTLHGFHLTGAGAIRGLSCVRCWSSTNGIATINGRGFRIVNGDGLSFTDSRVINNGGHGVEVGSAVKDLAISGGLFTGNCVAAGCSAGGAHGIVLTGTNGFRISGVRSGQAVGSPNKQGYGIFINTGCTNYIVTGNDTRTNVTGGIANIPGLAATRIVSSNL